MNKFVNTSHKYIQWKYNNIQNEFNEFKYLNLILSMIHNFNNNNKLIIEHITSEFHTLYSLSGAFYIKNLFVAIKEIELLPITLIF